MTVAAQPNTTPTTKGWTFLTNHAHVLLAIVREPTARLRDIVTSAGITECAAQTIVADLEAAGYLHRERVGRRSGVPTTDHRTGTRHRNARGESDHPHHKPMVNRPVVRVWRLAIPDAASVNVWAARRSSRTFTQSETSLSCCGP